MPIDVKFLAKLVAKWFQIRNRLETLDAEVRRYAKAQNRNYAVLHPDSIAWLRSVGYQSPAELRPLGWKKLAA